MDHVDSSTKQRVELYYMFSDPLGPKMNKWIWLLDFNLILDIVVPSYM